MTLSYKALRPELLELMALDGEPLVRGAYRLLLRRSVDPASLPVALERLRAGEPKEKFIAELQASAEARLASRRYGIQPLVALDNLLGPVPVVPPGTEMDFDAQPEATTVDDLLALPLDTAFLRAAYWQLLGRRADEAGLAHLAESLRLGWSRMYVLKVLHESEEGRKAQRALPGLSRGLTRYKKAQSRSWAGWYTRNVLGVEADFPRDRQLRAVFRWITEIRG